MVKLNKAFGLFILNWFQNVFRSEKFLNKLRKMIAKAKEYHDELIFNKGFLKVYPEHGDILFTNKQTFDKVITRVWCFIELVHADLRLIKQK